MYRDPSEFRERFKAYKEGKSVREIYGLPGYAGGKFDASTKKKIDYYYKLLRNNGFDMMSAIGILGNMMQESSFDPDVVNHLGYHGLLLNSKAIQNAIKNLYGDLSEQSQLRYLSDWTDGATWIRKGPYASDTALYSKSYLRSGYRTPEQAAYEFLKRYERAIVVDPKTKKALRDANGNYVYLDKDKRLGYAKSIYNYLSGRPDGILDLIALVGATQPEPIIAVPDATRVSTIPTIQLKAIDYSDRRNSVVAEAERAMWAHNVMEDMKGAYQVPIWESPSLPALTPVEYDVNPLKTYAGGKVSNEPVITQGRAGSRLDKLDSKNGKLPGYSNGKIRIKPANRGKFNATKKRTGKTTEELTHSKNPLTRKRAIFAQNARKWHHADGKLPSYEDGRPRITTSGAGVTSVYLPAPNSPEVQPTVDLLERIANFLPYVGTIQDWEQVVNGNIGKVPSAVIGTVADVFLPGLRSSYKAAKAYEAASKAAPKLVDKIKYYKASQKAYKKATANVGYLVAGTYEDILDDLGYQFPLFINK